MGKFSISRTDKRHCLTVITVALLALGCTTTLNAQDLRFQTGAAYLDGIRPAVVQVLFNAGDASIQQYTMSFTYPASMLEPPTVSACAAAAQCTVDAAKQTVNVSRSASAKAALGSEMACMMEFSATESAMPGFALLSVSNAQFTNSEGMPVAGSSPDGSVLVVPGESSPVWQFNPAADPDCRSDSQAEVGIAPAASTLIPVHALGSTSETQPVAISCGVSQGFTLLSGGEQDIHGEDQPLPLELSCNTGVENTGTLVCLEGSSAGERFYLWDLVCADALFTDGFESLN